MGQHPAWGIEPEPNIQAILGAHSDFFKKGLVCESQGYGIGAFGYFRRIVEEVIDELLNSIADILDGTEKEKYTEALEATKKTTVAQEKIELVKDLLPSSLKPNGMNPLQVLHSALSNGMHSESDENCLESVDAIKNVLVYLIKEVKTQKEASKMLTDSMRKILEKKNQKSKK